MRSRWSRWRSQGDRGLVVGASAAVDDDEGLNGSGVSRTAVVCPHDRAGRTVRGKADLHDGAGTAGH